MIQFNNSIKSKDTKMTYDEFLELIETKLNVIMNRRLKATGGSKKKFNRKKGFLKNYMVNVAQKIYNKDRKNYHHEDVYSHIKLIYLANLEFVQSYNFDKSAEYLALRYSFIIYSHKPGEEYAALGREVQTEFENTDNGFIAHELDRF